MLNVSSDFETAINDSSRNFHVLKEILINDGVTPTASCATGTNVDNVCDGLFRPTDYNSVGSIVKQAAPGWIGSNISDQYGNISPEIITISYAPSINSKNLWVIGRKSNYPVNFVVELKQNGTWSTVADIVNNTSWYWFMQLDGLETIDAFRITITKISTNSDKALITECGVVYKLLLGDDDVQDLNVLAEACSEARNPIGVVTSNELTADINNEDGWYTITSNGPLSGLIYPGIKVITHIGIQVLDGDFEFAKLGTFYVTDWAAPSSSISASLTANDRLLKLMDLPAQNKMVVTNVTVKGLFEYLFTSIGLTPSDYEIDNTLTRVINVGWIPTDKVGDVLQSYSIAGMCVVFVNADDVIRVVDLMAPANPVATITEDNQIISLDNSQGFSNVYSSVEVNYKSPRLSDITQLLSIENTVIPVGTSTISKATFTNPVGAVSFVSLVGAVKSSILSISYGVQSIDVTVQNTGTAAETVTLVVNGMEIESDGATIDSIDDNLYSMWPDKVLEIDSDFIQNQQDAQEYADSLIKLASNPQAVYTLVTRGNPSFELMDTLKVQGGDFIKAAQDINAVVIRQSLTYDGGLSCELLLRDPLV